MIKAECFTRVFWGWLLLACDFHVMNFDLLPDALGLVLVALGCHGLSSVSKHFTTAALVSWARLGQWSLSFVVRSDGIMAGIDLVLDALTFWFFWSGVIVLASRRQNVEFAERARIVRLASVVATPLALLLLWAAHAEPAFRVLGFVAIALCILPLGIYNLYLVHRAKRELADVGSSARQTAL